MCSPSAIQHFSVRKSGTIRRRCGVIRLRRNCVISSFYIKYIALPQSSTFPTGKVARYAKGVALPPLNKGRCFILLRMKRFINPLLLMSIRPAVKRQKLPTAIKRFPDFFCVLMVIQIFLNLRPIMRVKKFIFSGLQNFLLHPKCSRNF